jgi:pullulanase
MKKLIRTTLLFLTMLTTASAQNAAEMSIYDGKDLGLTYSKGASILKIWSPSAVRIMLRFYKKDGSSPAENDVIEAVEMKKSGNGTWLYAAKGDRKGQYYTVQVTTTDGKTHKEVPDIYAKAVGANGLRAQIVDLKTTNPAGWTKEKSPVLAQKTDAIIYELHIRDMSIAANSGIAQKGKFLGLTQSGTFYTDSSSGTPAGGQKVTTGLDHIKELGVTHVQILPFYDYFTVDETKSNDPTYKKYNWGYDPLNYNAPEGSYSTNATDGATRIRELKQMIQTLHKNGLRVIMDVVYNHTMFGEESYFNQIAPHYYHRFKGDNTWSNASGCGNETASDKPMMRKFMLESVKHWVEEYHIDGFRFDLMAIHDIETMNLISSELHKIKPSIILLGEGWTSGDSPLPEERRSLKRNVPKLDRIAAFSDDMRDALKGSVFDAKDRGFASGKSGTEESIKFGIVAATQHPQVDYSKVNYSKERWAAEPFQCINYAECHDNHALWDRFLNSNATDSEETRIKMHQLAQTIVLTSQGVAFLHAGTEFLRTKKGVENSFNSPDSINEIDWSRKLKYQKVNEYFRQIIALRRNHPAFRMGTAALIQQNLTFVDAKAFDGSAWYKSEKTIMYTLNGAAVGDSFKRILVIYNGNTEGGRFQIPAGNWKIVLDGQQIVDEKARKMVTTEAIVPAISAMVLAEY